MPLQRLQRRIEAQQVSVVMCPDILPALMCWLLSIYLASQTEAMQIQKLYPGTFQVNSCYLVYPTQALQAGMGFYPDTPLALMRQLMLS